MFGKPHITVLGVNHATGFVQIHVHGSRYTCPTKTQGDELVFLFKNTWYPVNDFTDNYTQYFN